MLGQDTIRGKYWTLRLKEEYKIQESHMPQKNDSHDTIPPPDLPIEIICWNNKWDLSFFTQSCFGDTTYNKTHAPNFYNGYLLEVDIKLKENLPGQNISSFVIVPKNNFSSQAHGWNGTVSNEDKVYYGYRKGIYHQLTYNKKTGSYFFYEYDKKTHHANYYGAYRYNDGTGHYDIWFNDRQYNLYSKREITRCTDIVWQNQGYLGQMAYIEPKTSGTLEFTNFPVTFLTMSTSTVYCKQYANGAGKNGCSCNNINQPSGCTYNAYFYYGHEAYGSHIALSNSKRTVHIHFPSNAIWIGNWAKLMSTSCGTNIHKRIDDNTLSNGHDAKNLNLPPDMHPIGERKYWDINEDNVVVCRTKHGISVLNLGTTSNLDANTLKLPSVRKIRDSVGKTIRSVWRNVRFSRDFYINGEKPNDTVFNMQQLRINDSNNIVTISSKFLFVTTYNTQSNRFEYSEMFNIGEIDPKYRCVAINDNDEIVIVDLWSGKIYIYRLENNANTHNYAFASHSRSIILQNSTLQDPISIEEAISIDVKHRISIEQCEIVISPRELDDPNLIPLDGRILLKSNEPFLYSIFGDIYRTNDVDLNSFKLPDLRGRYPIGRVDDKWYDEINAQIQTFALESLNDFGFNPINNQIKKYYKSVSAKSEVNLTNAQAVKSIELKNTDVINTERKSISIDDKCFMFYIRKVD